MNYLNEKWTTFRTAVEAVTVSITLIGTGIWSFNAAEAVRGYRAAGGEFLLTVGAGILVGIIAHKILNKVEAKLNERFAAENEARRMEAFRKAARARMFTIGEEQKRKSRFLTFTVGE